MSNIFEITVNSQQSNDEEVQFSFFSTSTQEGKEKICRLTIKCDGRDKDESFNDVTPVELDEIHEAQLFTSCYKKNSGWNFEGDSKFRPKFEEINQLGLFTFISQSSSKLSKSSDARIRHPSILGLMDKNKAQLLMNAIDESESRNLIYVVDAITNYNHQLHSNLIIRDDSIIISYNLFGISENNGLRFSLNNNDAGCDKNYMCKQITKINPDNYCVVSFMDNRINDELFDTLIVLLTTITQK